MMDSPSTSERSGTSTSRDAPLTEKTIQFFLRLRTVYPHGRLKTLWGEDSEGRRRREIQREWSDRIAKLTPDQFARIFEQLKDRLEQDDPDYFWPDVARILALRKKLPNGELTAQKRIFRAALPMPEAMRRQHYAVGRLGSQTAMAIMQNRACLIEDRPA